MNLWAKSFGRLALFAVALFFSSCEDESSFLGFKNPNPKFNVSYVDIPLESSVMLIDSIYTDNKDVQIGALLGEYQDNRMGTVRSEAYFPLTPSFSAVIPDAATFDSVTVQFRFNYYGYGFSGDRVEKFTIHEITSDSLSRIYATRFKASTRFTYNSTPMAEASVFIDYDSLKKQAALKYEDRDTLIASARLSDDFGKRLFALSKKYTFEKNNPDRIDFVSQLKGIVLVPSQSSAILGIGIESLSRVMVHYHAVVNNVDTKLTRAYLFNYPAFSQITTDRSTSDLSSATLPYRDIVPGSGLRYVQSGTPVITKLDLTNFYKFADTVSNVVINEAKLIIEGVESSEGLLPHSTLALKLINNNNYFFNSKVPTERQGLFPYGYTGVIFSDALTRHYYVNSDEPSAQSSPATLAYNSTTNSYSTFVTLFTQTLFKNKDVVEGINSKRINYLGIFPATPSVSHTVARTVFDQSKVKLRIYFTRPLINNTP